MVVTLLRNGSGDLLYSAAGLREYTRPCVEECCDECEQTAGMNCNLWDPATSDCENCPLTSMTFTSDAIVSVTSAGSLGEANICSGTITNFSATVIRAPGDCIFIGAASADGTDVDVLDVCIGYAACSTSSGGIYTWAVILDIYYECQSPETFPDAGSFSIIFSIRRCAEDGDCIPLGTYTVEDIVNEIGTATVSPTAIGTLA